MVGAAVFLVRVRGIKRLAFVDVSIAVPVAGPGTVFRGTRPDKSVTRVEHGHAIHEISNRSKARECFGRWNGSRAGQPIKHMLICRKIWKTGLPRSHGVATQTGRADVDPI